MKSLLVFASVLLFADSSVLGAAPEVQTDFYKTLSAATKEKKMAFILLGRPTCGNCNATKAMIRAGKIPVTAQDYVMGDLNVDDPKTQGEFVRKYAREQFGNTLPLVVVADSHGKALASSSGMRSAAEWKTILQQAKAKAANTP